MTEPTTTAAPSSRDIREAKNALLTKNPDVDAVIALLIEDPEGWRSHGYTIEYRGGDLTLWVQGWTAPHFFYPERPIGLLARRKLRKAVAACFALKAHRARERAPEPPAKPEPRPYGPGTPLHIPARPPACTRCAGRAVIPRESMKDPSKAGWRMAVDPSNPDGPPLIITDDGKEAA